MAFIKLTPLTGVFAVACSDSSGALGTWEIYELHGIRSAKLTEKCGLVPLLSLSCRPKVWDSLASRKAMLSTSQDSILIPEFFFHTRLYLYMKHLFRKQETYDWQQDLGGDEKIFGC